jgi:hypothetical protein
MGVKRFRKVQRRFRKVQGRFKGSDGFRQVSMDPAQDFEIVQRSNLKPL